MKLLKALKYLALSIYVMCGVALAVFLIPATGWKALTVLTGSMHPAIPQGSLVIIHNVPLSQLHPGDVVTYQSPANAHQTITHRIIGITSKHGVPYLTTKGDANKAADPQFVGGRVVGRVEYHVPVAGSVIHLAVQPLGVLLLVGIPGLLIIIDEFRLMRRRLQKLAVAPPPSAVVHSATARPATPVTSVARHSVRPLIRAVLPLACVVGAMAWLATATTRANWTDSTTLSANQITATADGSGSGSGSCGSGAGGTNVNTVTVTTTNAQTATTGNATSTFNTHTSTTTGNASNTNNQSTTVSICN